MTVALANAPLTLSPSSLPTFAELADRDPEAAFATWRDDLMATWEGAQPSGGDPAVTPPAAGARSHPGAPR